MPSTWNRLATVSYAGIDNGCLKILKNQEIQIIQQPNHPGKMVPVSSVAVNCL